MLFLLLATGECLAWDLGSRSYSCRLGSSYPNKVVKPDYDTAIQRLTEHFSPTENKDMAIFDFRQVTEQSGESIDEFYRRLKEKFSLCGFHDEDNKIKTPRSYTKQQTVVYVAKHMASSSA